MHVCGHTPCELNQEAAFIGLLSMYHGGLETFSLSIQMSFGASIFPWTFPFVVCPDRLSCQSYFLTFGSRISCHLALMVFRDLEPEPSFLLRYKVLVGPVLRQPSSSHSPRHFLWYTVVFWLSGSTVQAAVWVPVMVLYILSGELRRRSFGVKISIISVNVEYWDDI